MANNIIKRIWNQNKMVNIEALQGMAFQAEDGGHTFEISGVDDSGATVSLSGTVAGVFRRPDNADIALTGAASDGKVSVTLTEDCYAVPGRFGLTIFVTADSKKTAVYAAIGTVSSTSGGAVAGDTPQDVVDLINAIAAAVATIPADYSDLTAAIAPTYSPSSLYPIGYYVWYNGKLYRCKTAITTAESWTAAHWTAVALSDACNDTIKLSVKYTAVLPNGTDFDTLLTPGSYLVENYSQMRTHTHTPPGVATGGRLFVYQNFASSRQAQVWVSFDGSGNPQIFIRCRYGTGWERWSCLSQAAQTNLRVVGYNIGEFNYGRDGGLSENVSEKIANYKRFFGDTNPDVALFAELSEYIDSGSEYTSANTLINPLFDKNVNFHQCAVSTNLIDAQSVDGDDGGIYLRNNNNEYAGAVGRMECYIGNKKLLIAGGFLRVLSSAQDRLEAFVNFLNAVSSYDYCIIYLDTNVQNLTERGAIYNAATSAGYTVCNGGYFGLFDTLVSESMYKPIDNIFVKGNIKVKNFYSPNVYADLSSDHLPVVADLTLY